MYRRFSVNFALFSMVVDFLVIALALLVAVMIRPQLNSLRFVREVSEFMVIPAALYLIFPLMWVGILILFSVYDGQRNLRVVDELSSLTLGSIMAMVAIAGILFITYRDISRVLYLVFVLLAYLSLVAWRVAFRLVFRSRNGKGEDRIRVLIAGAGKVGREFELPISQNSFPGFSIVGFLDDDPEKRLNQNDVLGDLSETRDLVITHNVTDVVLALPPQAFQRLSWLVSELHDLPIKVWVIPDYFGLALHKAVFEEFAGVPLLDLRAPALNENQRMVKRSFDLIVTVILLPLLLPLMVLIALGVRFDSPGPIIFRQKRVGENGRTVAFLRCTNFARWWRMRSRRTVRLIE
jgi:FlaA1/EpsC-like NDP-sugar epimerase